MLRQRFRDWDGVVGSLMSMSLSVHSSISDEELLLLIVSTVGRVGAAPALTVYVFSILCVVWVVLHFCSDDPLRENSVKSVGCVLWAPLHLEAAAIWGCHGYPATSQVVSPGHAPRLRRLY